MPFAANGVISHDPIDGGIEITDAQYSEALEGILVGKQVSIEGGFSVGFPPEPDVPVPAPPTVDEIKAQFEGQTQAFMDGKARDAGYDSLLTAISYAEEPAVPRFQIEGKAFRAWRSLVWAFANEQLTLVLSGAKEQPTVEAFLADLPALELPA